ncbi:MAG: hypothetical protein Q9193_006276 [Seirophora villosa]
MKTNCASVVAFLFTALLSCVAAVPAAGDNTLQARAAPPTQADILNLATDTFAVQLVGAQTTPAAIKFLCTDYDTSRLQASGYNVTALKSIFCQASSVFPTSLPDTQAVRALTVQYSSWIWIFQAVGALKGDQHRLKLLCRLIDVGGSFSVGHNGTLVKSQICNVGNGGELPAVPLPVFGA